MRIVVAALAFLAGTTTPVRAQGILDKLGLDKLQLASLGLSAGRIDPTQVEPATVFAITADYGDIAPRWRLVFSASYWESRLSDDAVNRFLDTLRANIVDPTGDDSIKTSRIPLYDVTLSIGIHYSTSRSTLVRPYAGVGIAAHVINAEGKLIKGTFVERSLDDIAAGFFSVGGIEFRPLPQIVFDGEARADLLSGFRALQLRVGATYVLGPPRRPTG
jgi:hypothetical protein